MQKYDPTKIEKKWQKYWSDNKTFATHDNSVKPKYYVLDMFPYPSGAGLHVGHPKGYIATDILARQKMMRGFEVLHPMGWDAFGLPAENYALKNKTHPAKATADNIATFKKQLALLGFTYDWEREINTTDPNYYRFTQWIFLEMFKRGLAYESYEPINWCPGCQTGLANEDLEGGVCERCGSTVERKPMRQWVLRITNYADRLLADINKLSAWPEPIKEMQRNWIGRSEGAEVKFIAYPGMEIVFATDNQSKIKRVQKLLNSRGVNIKVLSAKDAELEAQDLIEGVDILENARNKALAYKGKTNKMVLALDTALFIDGHKLEPAMVKRNALGDADEKKLSQKEIAAKILAYYQNIAKKNGGEVSAYWLDAFALLAPNGEITTATARREVTLTDKIKGEVDEFFPIRSLYIVQKTKKRPAEQTSAEELQEMSPVTGALLKLLTSELKVFTTRPDTLFGATYCVLSPEHELVGKWAACLPNKKEVLNYIAAAKNKSELERTDLNKEKTGVELKGVKAVNPANNESLPLWIADYVLANYGTGAIMAVPAHDERDCAFASKFNLPIRAVVKQTIDEESQKSKVKNQNDNSNVKSVELFVGEGAAVNSGFLDGLATDEAKTKMIEWLNANLVGRKQVNYKLRDWVFSRQRYWGEPIPLVYCEACKNKKYRYLLLHGRHGSKDENFFPWLKEKLLANGHEVCAPNLPRTEDPHVEEQADFVIANYQLDENTIIVGHSLGGPVALKVLEKTGQKVARVIMIDSPIAPKFMDHPREDIAKNFDWHFDWQKIRPLAKEFVALVDANYPIITPDQFKTQEKELGAQLVFGRPQDRHFCDMEEPLIWQVVQSTGWVPVPENELPIKLPAVKQYEPTGTGESPLAGITDWVNTTCPHCGGEAKRETNTMPQWAGSCWYYLRYLDPKNNDKLVAETKEKYWMPVDCYVGGAEHATRHLIYARFWHKFLYDIGTVTTLEPFTRLQNVGLILAEDGRKMSKRWGNVINPEEVVKEFGADAMRVYEMFMGPFDQPCAWSTKGLVGTRRFLDRVWDLSKKVTTAKPSDDNAVKKLHQSIKKVTDDIDAMRFNTAISQLMILSNAMNEAEHVHAEEFGSLLKLLSPFAPHLCEELWQALGNNDSIIKATWPQYNATLAKEENITIAVQINGKLRSAIIVPAESSEEEIKQMAFADEKTQKWLDGTEPKKIIYVKNKLVSVVV